MEHLSAAALFELGRAALGENRREQALQLFRESLSVCERDNNPQLRPAIHVEIGRVARNLADNESASRHYRTAAELYRSVKDGMNLAHALRHAADILRQMDRRQEATPLILEAMNIYRSQQPLPQLHLANALRVAALIAEQQGNHADALPLWVEARDHYRAVGVDAGVAESRVHLAAAGATQTNHG